MSAFRVPVDEYTTPNPITASEEASVEDLSTLMQENGIRHVPIVRGGNVVGVVSERDLRLVAGLKLAEKNFVRAADIMAPNPVMVDREDSLDDVAFEMSEKKIGSVMVMDEDNELYGIFTATDALNALIEIARSLDSKK